MTHRKVYDECKTCRHWFITKDVCRDTFPQLEKFDEKEKKIVCTRYAKRYGV